MTLEEQLLALIEEHNLTTISLSVSRLKDGTVFYSSNAHGPDANGIQRCSGAPHNLRTIKETVAVAIGTLNEMRAVGTVAIGKLSTMGDQA